MKRLQWVPGVTRTSMLLSIALVVMPAAAQAYVGPGAGLTAIGTLIALFAAMLLALVGFVWYPIKRMRRARKAKTELKATRENES